MKSAGLFHVDQREFRADMRAAINFHQSHVQAEADDILEASLRGTMREHGYSGTSNPIVDNIRKLCRARNHDRARKFLDNVFPDFRLRLPFDLLYQLTRKLFWPVIAALVALTIYHMVAT